MVEYYAFPNVYIGIGSTNDFIKDIQKSLGLEPSGEFDFVTMCYVTVHKHKNGLGYQDPVVDQPTWDSLFKGKEPAPDTLTSTDRLQSVSSPESIAVTPKTDYTAPTVTTGTTEATTANAPIPEDQPVVKTDANTTTAEEQKASQGEPVPTANTQVEPAPAPVVEPAPVAPVAPVVEPAPALVVEPAPVAPVAPVEEPKGETPPGEQNV